MYNVLLAVFFFTVSELFAKGHTISLFLIMERTSKESFDIDIVTRKQWGARPPVATETMTTPVPFVIIHHSYIPNACNTTEQCKRNMILMQNMHIDNNGWNDIGYSFGVGGDGNIYEGRGWYHVGAHAPKYNDKSIGICVIGDWRDDMPPDNQLNSVRKLIEYGINMGMIKNNYSLYGHRQVRKGTECPGETLYEEIQNWPHFSDVVPYIYKPN